MRYAPNFASEKLLPGPPYKGCGVASDWIATDIATFGESSRQASGRIKLKTARTRDLKRGWAAFKARPDSNGIPDTDDLERIHAGMFPDLPQPVQLKTRDFREVIEALDDGYAISIALMLSALPASSSLRAFTSADHQVVIVGRNNAKTTRLDPMHGHSLTYTGDPVLLADVETAAKAIEHGLILGWLYPRGGWTAESLLRKRKNRQIQLIETAAGATESRLRRRIRELEATTPPDCEAEIANAKAAGRESAFVQVLQSVQSMRSTPEG